MKVVISEVTNAHEAILASGLSSFIESIGVSVEAPRMSLNVASAAPAPQPAPSVSALARAATKKAKSPRAAKTAPSQPIAAIDDAPRITIRQRIVNFLQSGPKTCAEVHGELVKQGISASVNTSRHLYLMKRDGLAQQAEDGRYSIK